MLRDQQEETNSSALTFWGGGFHTDKHLPKSPPLIWRGVSQDTLSNNGDKNQKMVQNAISKMFKQWPKS
jgi:hypothetical protein